MTFDPNHNPWKTLDTRHIYKNPWISVREDKVITPSGTPGIYGVVETRTAVGVVALTNEQEVYMVGQYRYPMKEYTWELVEGGGERTEAPIEIARRELKEETGVTADTIIQLGNDIHLSNCHSDERGYIFLATGLTEGVSAPDDTEELQVRKVLWSECMRMMHSGEIKDALTVVGLTRAAHHLKI